VGWRILPFAGFNTKNDALPNYRTFISSFVDTSLLRIDVWWAAPAVLPAMPSLPQSTIYGAF
jgi:hypothetical protein